MERVFLTAEEAGHHERCDTCANLYGLAVDKQDQAILETWCDKIEAHLRDDRQKMWRQR